jgi:integrase
MTITSTILTRAISSRKAKKISDGAVKGFYARISKAGAADFIFRYRSPITDKDTTFVLGRYGKEEGGISIMEARKLAKVASNRVYRDQDPQLEKTEKKRKQKLFAVTRKGYGKSINVLSEKYLDHVAGDITLATLTEKKMVLNRLCEVYGEYDIADFKHTDGLEFLDLLVLNHTKSAAMKSIRHCSAFWNFTLEEGLSESLNIWANMKTRKKQYRSTPKSRWLDDNDLSGFIKNKFPELKENAMRATVVCLYTGCRQGMATSVTVKEDGRKKLIGMDWAEIKWDRHEWTLAAERMKAHNAQIIPLSDQFYNLLYSWWEADGKPESGPIVRAELNPHKYMSGTTYAKVFNKEDYSPHDFRRTVNTQLQRMGCPSDVRDHILSHINRSGVSMSYDMHDYMPERKQWLQKWADHLDILGFDDIVLKARQESANIRVVK